MAHRVSRKLHRQILRLLDGQMDEDDAALLEKELIRNPSANKLLREYAEIDRQCREALDFALAPSAAPQASRAPRPRASRRRGLRWVAAAAAAVLAAGLWVAWGALARPGPGGEAESAALNRPRPQPQPPQAVPRTRPPLDRVEGPWAPVRRIDRYRIDVFDEQTNELHRLSLDHEHLPLPASLEGL